jgi:GGDEF domain-containing protein
VTSVTSGAVTRTVSSTVGVAWAPAGRCAPSDLIARADASMYAGKAARAVPGQPSAPGGPTGDLARLLSYDVPSEG